MSFTSNEARFRIWSQTLNLDTAVLKMMLVSSAYTPDKDHDFVASITGGSSKELTGTGYVAGFAGAGRKTLASTALTKDTTNDLIKLAFTDVTWSAINAGTIRYAVIIVEGTSDADSLIVAVIDINPSAGIVTDGNDWVFRCGTNGAIAYKAA